MQNQPIKPRQKLARIIGVTGWSRRHTAELLRISSFSLSRYLRGFRKPPAPVMAKVDFLYEAIVTSLECEITPRMNAAEKALLQQRIKSLPSNQPHCGESS